MTKEELISFIAKEENISETDATKMLYDIIGNLEHKTDEEQIKHQTLQENMAKNYLEFASINLEDTGLFNYKGGQSSVYNRFKDNGINTLQELFEADELTIAINRIVEDINHRFTLSVLTRDLSRDIFLVKCLFFRFFVV